MGEGYLTGRDEEDEKKSKWELVRKKSGGDVLEPDEIDSLKSKLYPYLKDKAARRQSATSGANYASNEAQFAEDQGRYNAGALLGAMSKWQSQAGTLGGKRSDVEIVEPMNKALNDSAQQRYKNELALREQEESALGTDLRIGQFIAGQDEKDKERKFQREEFDWKKATEEEKRAYLSQKLRSDAAAAKQKGDYDRWKTGEGFNIDRERLQIEREKAGRPNYSDSTMEGPDGSIYGLDRNKGYVPSALPKGSKPQYKPSAAAAAPGFGNVVPGYTDADGNPITYNPKTGATGKVELPAGSKNKDDNKASKDWIAEAAKADKMANYLETQLKIYDAKPNDQEKIVFGRSMLKALNSAFGPDAIGVDEAKRLGGNLDFGFDFAGKGVDPRPNTGLFRKQIEDQIKTQRGTAEMHRRMASGEKASSNTTPPPGAKKSVDEMSEEEVDAELKRRGLVK